MSDRFSVPCTGTYKHTLSFFAFCFDNQLTLSHVNFDLPDPDDPEYRRNLQRPAEVKEDMKQMEGRSRVSVVLNSQAFKEELEAIIHEQIRQGGPASIFALQQISDLLLPQSRGGSSLSRCKYKFFFNFLVLGLRLMSLDLLWSSL